MGRGQGPVVEAGAGEGDMVLVAESAEGTPRSGRLGIRAWGAAGFKDIDRKGLQASGLRGGRRAGGLTPVGDTRRRLTFPCADQKAAFSGAFSKGAILGTGVSALCFCLCLILVM